MKLLPFLAPALGVLSGLLKSSALAAEMRAQVGPQEINYSKIIKEF